MADPRIRYCCTSDGVSIAYTTVGEGPPLLYMRRFMAAGLDDEVKFSFSTWRPLARVRSVVLMDIRGSGLSEPAPDATFDQWILDMEAVVDALNVNTIDIGGELTPCHFVLGYATHDPHRVGKMVLWNPPPSSGSPRARQPEWLRALAAQDWRSFCDLFALQIFGWKRADAAERFAERLRLHFTHQQYEHMMDAVESIEVTDVSAVLARTLIVADANYLAGDDSLSPERQAFMRRLAARMPNAELSIIKLGDLRGAGDAAVRFLEPEGNGRAASTRPDDADTAVILFADVVDSTATTARLGNAAFRDRMRRLDDALRKVIREAGGIPVEGRTLGDGVLGVFTSAAQSIRAALQCDDQAGRVGLQLHLGIHAGDVLRESGGISGIAVSIAARISDLTAPNEILVSSTVRDLARASTDVTFEDRGEYVLKGITEPQRVYAIRGAGG